MASSSPPPPDADAQVDALVTGTQTAAPAVSELKGGSGRKREREGSMEPSDKMSALKLAALGLKKVKEDAEPSAIAGSSNQRLSKSPPASVAPQSPPSATPSVTDASSPTASSSKTAAADAVPQPKPKQPTFSSFTSSGFGSVAASGSSTAFSAFANAKPFGSTAGSSSTANAAGTFGDILSKGGRTSKADEAAGEGVEESGVKADAAGEASDPADDSEGDGVVKLAAQDTITGEEDEDTRHQVRCKLYLLEKEGTWKERGTGILKLNVNVDSAKPRLLMRADGVLRLILNVALFPGMHCERQDKWVRFTAFEDAHLSHLAVRTSSVKSAEELFDKIQALMPSNDLKTASAAKAPTSAAAAADVGAAKPKPPPLIHSTSTEVTFKDETDPPLEKSVQSNEQSAV